MKWFVVLTTPYEGVAYTRCGFRWKHPIQYFSDQVLHEDYFRVRAVLNPIKVYYTRITPTFIPIQEVFR